MGLASLFTVPAPAVRIKISSHAALEPARRFAKTLDQGFGTVHFGQAGLDVAQPRQIGLAGLLSQSQLGVLQFPK